MKFIVKSPQQASQNYRQNRNQYMEDPFRQKLKNHNTKSREISVFTHG